VTIGTLAPPSSNSALSAFPATAVETTLRGEFIQAIKDEAFIRGIALPPLDSDIAKTTFQADSLVAVSILCVVEPIVGFELPESVVRTGGYRSVDSALYQLLPRIEAQWKKRKGGKP
jgi:hypothetical protein